MSGESKAGRTAVILVDHGSRRAASNDQLLAAAELFRQETDWPIVEPAHMELAEPSIETAMDRCVAAGAESVVVFPWFLAPGRHWAEDIPRLVNAAAEKHPNIKTLVTAPFGNHELLVRLATERIEHCLRVADTDEGCDVCQSEDRCRLNATRRSS